MRKLLVVRRRRAALKSKSRSIVQVQVPTRHGGLRLKEYPIRDLDGILVIGAGVYIEAGLLGVLSQYNVPLTVVAKDNVSIMTTPIVVVDNHYRLHQYTAPPEHKLALAAAIIEARLQGMKNILEYYGRTPPETKPPPGDPGDPEEYEQRIRAWEAEETRRLWQEITTLIPPEQLRRLREEYGFQGRRPRHPDPFNKTLSIMYAVLYTLATKALLAAGLDPTLGLLHRTRYSTPLTFDYTEMYKPAAIQATLEYLAEHDLPPIGPDQEIPREHVNKIIRKTYEYLRLKHRKTKKTLYTYIYLKANCLAKNLAGTCPLKNTLLTWNRKQYTKP